MTTIRWTDEKDMNIQIMHADRAVALMSAYGMMTRGNPCAVDEEICTLKLTPTGVQAVKAE